MNDETAADYAETLPDLCKALVLKASNKHWINTESLIDASDDPFASGKQVAHYLGSANLAEVRQSRHGNRFGFLAVRLNERGEYLKQFMLAQTSSKGAGA